MKVTWEPTRAQTVFSALALVGAMHSLPSVAAAPTPAELQTTVFDVDLDVGVDGDARLRQATVSEVNRQVHLFYGGLAMDLPPIFELDQDGQRTLLATVLKGAPTGASEMIVAPAKPGS
jgi:hypothetical protein